MILTTISTAAGFLSLLVTDVQPIRQLGIFTAIGIVFAGIISFFSLPALISRSPGLVEPPHGADRSAGDRRPQAPGRRPGRRRSSSPAPSWCSPRLRIPQLAVDSDQLFFFKDDDPIRRGVRADRGAVRGRHAAGRRVRLRPLGRTRATRRDPGGFGCAGGGAPRRAQRSSRRRSRQTPYRPNSSPAVLDGEVDLPLGDLVTSDGMRFMLLAVQTSRRMTSRAGRPLRPTLPRSGSSPACRSCGTRSPVSCSAPRSARSSLPSSSSPSCWRSATARLRETLVALVPILLTVVDVARLHCASGIQLNLLTAIVSSIVIGVGIDYSIHFVAAIDLCRAERRRIRAASHRPRRPAHRGQRARHRHCVERALAVSAEDPLARSR